MKCGIAASQYGFVVTRGKGSISRLSLILAKVCLQKFAREILKDTNAFHITSAY
jgi:hypothetical protein